MLKTQSLYSKLEEVQKGKDDLLIDVIHHFEPKINHLLHQTSTNNREDLKQELYFLLIKKSKEYPIQEVPGFYEFLENKIEQESDSVF